MMTKTMRNKLMSLLMVLLVYSLGSTAVSATKCYYLDNRVQVDLGQGVINAGTFFLYLNKPKELFEKVTPAICGQVQDLFESEAEAAILQKWGQDKVDRHFPNSFCSENHTELRCSYRYIYGTSGGDRCDLSVVSGSQGVKGFVLEERGMPAENQFVLNEDGSVSYRDGCEVQTYFEIPGSGSNELCSLK